MLRRSPLKYFMRFNNNSKSTIGDITKRVLLVFITATVASYFSASTVFIYNVTTRALEFISA